MRIDEETIDGFKTCARSRLEHGHCEGYNSVPAKVIRRVISKTFGDLDAHSTPADPYHHMPANSYEYVLPATEADGLCDHCGSGANVSLSPRAEYPRQPNTESPDAIVEKLAREREEKDESMSVAERQALALEEANALKRRELDLREAEVANDKPKLKPKAAA